MARPRLGESERRTRTIGVRATAAEEAELRERAQAARLALRGSCSISCPDLFSTFRSLT